MVLVNLRLPGEPMSLRPVTDRLPVPTVSLTYTLPVTYMVPVFNGPLLMILVVFKLSTLSVLLFLL